jgi:hypothetical protein
VKIEIEKQKIKKTIVHFIWQEREKKEKKTIINDNPTTVYHHTPQLVEEDIGTHPKRQ